MAGPFFNFKLKENNLALVPEQDESIYYPLYKDKSNKKSNLNNNSILNYSGLELTAAKQLYGVYDATNSKLDPADLNYDPRMFNDPYGIANSFVKQQSIYAPKTSGQKFANIGQNTLEGFMAGAQTGNIYAMIGGAAGGLATGIGQALAEDSTYRTDLATRSRNNAISSDIYNIMANQGLSNISNANALAYNNNISACGGKLYASGGNINNIIGTQEMEDDNVNIINEGGTHEMNPYGGVPQGTDFEGNPNLVEEGEVIFEGEDGTKNVLSNRIKPSKEDLQKSNLNQKYFGKTWAEIGKDIQNMFEGRNDPFSSKTKHELLTRCYNGQEYQKVREEAAQYGMTPEEYMAAQQEAQVEEQALQEQAMSQNLQDTPLEGYDEAQIQQLATEYGVSPDEMAQMIAEEQANYGALGGTFEYGPSYEYNPLLSYDNYLLSRSNINYYSPNIYADGGPSKSYVDTLLGLFLPEEQSIRKAALMYLNASDEVKSKINPAAKKRFENYIKDFGLTKDSKYSELPLMSSYFDDYKGDIYNHKALLDLINSSSEWKNFAKDMFESYKAGNPKATYDSFIKAATTGKYGPVSRFVNDYINNMLDSADTGYLSRPSVPQRPLRASTLPNPSDISIEPDSSNDEAQNNPKEQETEYINNLRRYSPFINPLRYTGAFDALERIINKDQPDTTYSDRLRQMYNPLYNYNIGNRYEYTPYDQYHLANQSNAVRNASIANARNMSGGNAALYNATVSGANDAYINTLSNLDIAAQDYNNKLRQQVTQLNNSLDFANEQQRRATKQYNDQLMQNTLGQAYAADETERMRLATVDNANRANLVENLQLVGDEQAALAAIRNDPSLLYSLLGYEYE